MFPIPTSPSSNLHQVQSKSNKTVQEMDFELGLKLTKCFDEFTSADLQITKDRAGPLFISRETDSMFILSAHLKGYRREKIKIDINEDGSRIVISGEKPVQETVMMGCKVIKKEIEMRRFRKEFKIPDGVILDKIKARFNRYESELTISMPKMVKGLRGVGVEEVKEEEMSRGNLESLQVESDEETKKETSTFPEALDQASSGKESEILMPERKEMDGFEVSNTTRETKGEQLDDLKGEIEKEGQEESGKSNEGLEEKGKTPQTSEEKAPNAQDPSDEIPSVESEIKEKGSEETDNRDGFQEPEDSRVNRFGEDSSPETEEKKFSDQSTQTDKPKKPKKCCFPMIAGSTLLVSTIVFVITMIRTGDKPTKKKQ